VRQLVDVTGLTEFEVGRALYALLSAGRLRRVATATQPVAREDQARLDEYRNLGVAFYRTGMLVEAEREFRRVVELSPGDANVRFQLGLIGLRQARWAEAAEEFRAAMAAGGRRPSALFNLALALEADGKLDEAEHTIAEAVEHATTDPRLWTGWGLLALRRGDRDPAMDRFTRARDLLEGRSPPAQWFWGMGWAQALSEAWTDAIATIREGVTVFPNHPVLRTTLGVLLEGTGEVAEAETNLRHALREDPTIPQISKNLGDLLYRAGRWDEAEEAYGRAVKLAPSLGDDIHFKLGNLACRRGDLVAARRSWQEALALNPEHALARANLSGSGGAT
jgi:Flp pilus assembly protein TadD